MKKLLVILCSLAILTAGCSFLNKADKAASTADIEGELSIDLTDKMPSAKTVDGEIKFYPTYDANYKTCKNDILEIWFDLPSRWTAKDESPDGLEYTIISDNDKVSLKVSGVSFEGTEEGFYNSLKGQAGTISDFTFRDGSSGKRIDVSEDEVYFVRPDCDSYVVFHVNARGESRWLDENKEAIEYIAMSIRITRESYGSSINDDKQITLEDLQLGEIKLGMTYEELLEILDKGYESAEVSESEYEGLVAKTLYLADETQILVVDDTVYSVNVISPDYPTPRGLKVGDSEKTLEQLYGEPVGVDDDNYWSYAYEGYELFTVRVENGKVAEIQIDVAM